MRKKMIETLLQHGLIVNPEDVENPGLLNTVVEKGNLKIVEDLLKYSADAKQIVDHYDYSTGLTPLHIAVKGKQVEMAKLLINYGANINVIDGKGTTLIVYAIQERDTKMAELLLTNGADIKDPKVLCVAAHYGCLKAVEDILKHDADDNMIHSSKYRHTPLHYAVIGKQVQIAQLLINYGANVNVKDSEGIIPIVYAIRNNDIEMTELLLSNGANIKDNPNFLDIAVENESLKIVEDLLKYGADVNMLITSKFGESLTPLHIAVRRKQMEMAKLLINYGANVNVKDGKGQTPIVYAIRNRDTKMTELLISNGANIKGDAKVLCAVAYYGCLKVVEDLLKDGADVNMLISSNFGESLTLLHSAVNGKEVETAKLLINYGANVNVKDGEGRPPLVYAIENNGTEMIELLLISGVNIKGDLKVLCAATYYGCLKVVEDLLKDGADVNMLTSSNFGESLTLLHSAVNGKEVEMAKLLINFGATVNVKDGKGQTPLVHAIRNRDTKMTELLLTNGADIKDNPNLLYIAVENGILKIVEDLLKDAADVNRLTHPKFGGRRTLLHIAVKEKHVEMAKLLINNGANVNVKDGKGQTPIVDAIENRDTKMTELLLINGADIKDNSNLLCTAVENGSLKIVKVLLKYGADVNMLENSYIGVRPTLLHRAVIEMHVQIAKLLIYYGANVNVKDGEGRTPIVYAIANNNTEMIELLLTNGADIKDNPNLLYTAVENGIVKIVEDLLKDGADVNMLIRPNFGESLTPLYIAVRRRKVKMAKLLINYGANVNVKDYMGQSPIVTAIQYGDTEMTKLLLTNGADIKDNSDLLFTAVVNGRAKIVEYLLKYAAHFNMLASSRFGICELLNLAVRSKYVQITKLLINYGANVNVKDGGTPIVHAIRNRDTKMTELLLSNGADIKDNPNLLYTAVENGILKIVEDLLKDAADVNRLTHPNFRESRTLLHVAVKEKHVEMAKLLINYGADVNVKDGKGQTPLVHAIRNRDTKMTELLLTNGADIKYNPNLLYIAVEIGILKIVEDLLKDAADVNRLTHPNFRESRTLLHIAVKEKHLEMAKLLINYGADVNVKDGKGQTPILDAIENRDTKMTKLLLTNGADIKDNPNLLYTAVENGILKIVEDLLKDGADVNRLTDPNFGESRTLLHIAVKGKQIEMAKLLINYGANVNVKDGTEQIPIVKAIQYGDTEMTKLLLTNGVDIKDNPDLLYTAVENGNLKIVEDLLKYDANINMLSILRCGSSQTLLHRAVLGKYVQIAKLLIYYGANVNVKDGEGRTPIVYAIANNNADMIELLLTNGADIKDNPDLLYTAVQNGILKIVEDLLKDCADVNKLTISKFGKSLSPLHIAVRWKQIEMAKLLINYGANVNVKGGDGKTLIVYAIRNRDTKMTELLLNNGAHIKVNSDLLCTAVENGSLEIVEGLLKYGADVNRLICPNFGESLTPLYVAVRGRKVEMAKLLINYGADVNVKDGKGQTPILDAIENRDTKMTKLLLTNGADIKDNPNLLYTAVENGILEIVEGLLKYGADVNGLIRRGFGESLTPLHRAVKGKRLEMAKLLINYGANVNNVKGSTIPIVYAIQNNDTEMTNLLFINGVDIKENPELLCIAVKSGSREIVEDLLKYGVDVNASDQYRRKALHYAVLCLTETEFLKCYMYNNQEIAVALGRSERVRRNSYNDIVEILLKCGAECDPGAEEDIKPLHSAAVEGDSKIVDSLLKFGAKVDSRDMHGRTALHFAVKHGHEQVVKTLLEYGSDVNIISKENHTPLEYGRLIERFCFIYDPRTTTTTLLIRHIAKMKAAGLHVSKRNLLEISNGHEINHFLNECEAEIEIMKSEKIGNSCASFNDILTKNTSQLVRNESIVQALKSANYKTKFPIYASMINSRFRRGVEREELLEQVRNKFLCCRFERLPELPLLCAEKIFSYLSDKDLRILLVACELFD